MALAAARLCLIMSTALLPCASIAEVPAAAKSGWSEKQLFEQAEEIPHLLAQKKISSDQIPNPHWKEDSCIACHLGNPTDGKARLRSKGEINALCNNCHDLVSVHNYIHAVGMAPSAGKKSRMPPQFLQALERGKGMITCISCHDLPMQCKKERFGERGLNPLFFRGGPYTERTGLCFNCHDAGNYERLNPHDQITDLGELNTQVCIVCHQAVPKRREAKSINDVTFNVGDDLTKLCTGCHPWRPHPGGNWARFSTRSNGDGPNHLVVPPPEIHKRLKATEQSKDMVLPLDPATGKIFCATCHNPHERGVQRQSRADRSADGYQRLRSSGSGQMICVSCHDK